MFPHENIKCFKSYFSFASTHWAPSRCQDLGMDCLSWWQLFFRVEVLLSVSEDQRNKSCQRKRKWKLHKFYNKKSHNGSFKPINNLFFLCSQYYLCLYTEIISIQNHVDFIISRPGIMVTILDSNTRIRFFTSNQIDYDSNYLALVELSYIWQENHRAPFFSYTSKLCKANLWATSKFLLQILKVVINWWAFKQCKLHIQRT